MILLVKNNHQSHFACSICQILNKNKIQSALKNNKHIEYIQHQELHEDARRNSQMTFQLQVKLLSSRLCRVVKLCHGVWHEEDGRAEERGMYSLCLPEPSQPCQ